VSDGAVGRFVRWSQRKHAARQSRHGSAAPAPLADLQAPGESADAIAARADSAINQPIVEQGLARAPDQADAGPPSVAGNATADITATLPPLDELTAESDYTQFLVDGVPQALKNAALRKLWTSDPVYAVLDGLNDYDEDFNLTDRIITMADTNYRIGRGFLDQDEPEPEPEPVDEPAGATIADSGRPGSEPASEPEAAGTESDAEGVAVAAGDPAAVDDNPPEAATGKRSQEPDAGPAETA
jgi:hypothetical protein